MQKYGMDYSKSKHGQQSNTPQSPQNLHPSQRPRRRPRRELPVAIKTGLTVVVVLTGVVAIEKCAPKEYKLSYLTGSYNREIAEAEKEGELNAQAKYEGWAVQYKYSYDQNLEQYKAVTQGMLRNYDGSYQLTNTAMSGYIQMHQQYKGVLYNYTQQTQAADMSLLNMATMWGRVLNLVESGAGDSALSYADTLNSEMKSELRSAASDDFPLELKEWQTKLPTPAQVRLELESIKLNTPPPLPQIGEDAYTKGK